MRIRLITLFKIKSFDGPTTLLLDESKSLYSISGKNGSGKSSVLRAIWVIQKIHFCEALNDLVELKNAQQDALRLLTAKDSYIRIEMSLEGVDGKSVAATMSLNHENGVPKISYTNRQAIDHVWNIDTPSNIFLLIDASKEFSTDTLYHNEIRISSESTRNLILQAIIRPDNLYHGIYKQLIMDYVHDRLVPSKVNRLAYYRTAKKIFSKLIPEVELSNFSGNHKEGEFVLLGKANRSRRSSLYDVRDFSSGEKTLLSTLVILCISNSISAVLIDEPENHLHENLLLSFINFLRDISQPKGMENWIQDSGNKPENISDVDQSDGHSTYNLAQVICSTHSKSLIYHTFSFGQNFLVANGIAQAFDEKFEYQLRKIGLSTIYKKVIFVEGEGDNAAFHHALSGDNVTIRPLSGSTAVTDTFKRIAQLHEYLRDSEFVFVVDSDNKPASFFSQLKDINPSFYDRYFVQLDRHELENYLLEPKLIRNVLESYSKIHKLKSNLPSEDEILKKIVELGKASLPQVYRKELSLAFQHIVSDEFSTSIWGDKSFDWSSEEVIQNRISSHVLSNDRMKNLADKLKKISKEVFSGYNTASDQTIVNRCDGKQVFGKVCAHFSRVAAVDCNVFKNVIYESAFSDPDSAAGNLVDRIKKILASSRHEQ